MISNLPGYFPLNVLEFDLQKLFIDKFACYNQCMSLYILEKTKLSGVFILVNISYVAVKKCTRNFAVSGKLSIL